MRDFTVAVAQSLTPEMMPPDAYDVCYEHDGPLGSGPGETKTLHCHPGPIMGRYQTSLTLLKLYLYAP